MRRYIWITEYIEYSGTFAILRKSRKLTQSRCDLRPVITIGAIQYAALIYRYGLKMKLGDSRTFNSMGTELLLGMGIDSKLDYAVDFKAAKYKIGKIEWGR